MSSGPGLLQPGERFAGYEVERVLASGGMGEVYVARHLSLDRRDAVKVLLPHLALDPIFRERFLREGKATASLSHPAVIPVHSAGEADGRLFLAMRLVVGSDLRSRLRRDGLIPHQEAVRVLGCVAGALDAADRAGLVHRDVKPGNILLGAREGGGTAGSAEAPPVYLADFGICRHRGGGDTLTPTGGFVGSIDYMAPEQIRAEDVDGRTDQYSLACVAFELLTGRTPFASAVPAATVNGHLDREPPSVCDISPGLPAEVDRVLRRALTKQRTERFPSASAFVDALATALVQPAAPAAVDDATTPGLAEVSVTWTPPSGSATRSGTRPVARPVEVPELGVAAGPLGGLRFRLPVGRTVLGRGESADLQVPDAFLSRRHVAIESGPGGELVVEDVGSANGTLLDGVPLDGRRELRSGALLQAGSSLLRRCDDAAVRERLSRGDLPDAVDVLPLARCPREEVQAMRAAAPLQLRVGWQPPLARPLTVRLADQPVALLGRSRSTEPLARWLLVQAAVLHSPEELGILTAFPTGEAERWSWVDQLPHAAAGGDGAGNGSDVGETLAGLSELVERRRRAGAGSWGRRLLVLADGRAAAAVALAERGAVVGVHVVAVGGRPHGAVVAEIDDRRGTLMLRREGEIVTGNPDGLVAEAAHQVVAALAS